MGWIKVTKNDKEYLISAESYKKVFKRQGYTIIPDKVAPTPKTPKQEINTEPKEAKANDGARKKVNKQVKV